MRKPLRGDRTRNCGKSAENVDQPMVQCGRVIESVRNIFKVVFHDLRSLLVDCSRKVPRGLLYFQSIDASYNVRRESNVDKTCHDVFKMSYMYILNAHSKKLIKLDAHLHICCSVSDIFLVIETESLQRRKRFPTT